MADLDHRQLGGRRHEEVHEAAREQLAVVVVHDPLVERAADALRDASVDLALDDDRVHDDAAVVLDDVPDERELAGGAIDLDDGRVHAAGERRLGRRVVAVRLEAGLGVLREDGALLAA